jgi:hypothetical protein
VLSNTDDITSGTGVLNNVWWEERGRETEGAVNGQSVEELGGDVDVQIGIFNLRISRSRAYYMRDVFPYRRKISSTLCPL